MSDTVSGEVIAGSLSSPEWTFLALPQAPPSDALHVNGAAYADLVPTGLLVEFRTLAPDLRTIVPAAPPVDLSPSPAGGYVALSPDAEPPVVAGALRQIG